MRTNSLSPLRTGSRRPFSGAARLVSVLVRGVRTALRGSAFRLVLLALPLLSFLPAQIAQAATIAVTNTSDSGLGSLRQAILDSNASVGALDTIMFGISGPGPYSIQPLSALPTITDPVIIDGTTQPGFVGAPIVEL